LYLYIHFKICRLEKVTDIEHENFIFQVGTPGFFLVYLQFFQVRLALGCCFILEK